MTMLEPGTYIDSHWGHYQSARTIELARSLEWMPEPQDGRTQEEECEYVDNLAIHYMQEGNGPDWWYELVEEAEDYLNRLCPDGYWFGHHADIGDVGVWPIDEDDL